MRSSVHFAPVVAVAGLAAGLLAMPATAVAQMS